MYTMDSDATSTRTLEKIVELEIALKAKVDAAQSRAAEELSKANVKAREILEDNSQRKDLAEQARTRVRAEGDKKLQDLEKERDLKREELRKRLSGNIPTTVDFIFSAICSSDVAKKTS